MDPNVYSTSACVVNQGIIKREEQYLVQKFGDEYLRYKSEVRRWI